MILIIEFRGEKKLRGGETNHRIISKEICWPYILFFDLDHRLNI